jgi:hypothetical protein
MILIVLHFTKIKSLISLVLIATLSLGWIPRIITVVYRFMFTIAVIAFLMASFKYYKAAVHLGMIFTTGYNRLPLAVISSSM